MSNVYCVKCKIVFTVDEETTANINVLYVLCPSCAQPVNKTRTPTTGEVQSWRHRMWWRSLSPEHMAAQQKKRELWKYSPSYREAMRAQRDSIENPRIKRFLHLMAKKFASTMTEQDYARDKRPNVLRYERLGSNYILRCGDEFALRILGTVHWIQINGKPLAGMVTPIGYVVRRPIYKPKAKKQTAEAPGPVHEEPAGQLPSEGVSQNPEPTSNLDCQ